MFKFIVDHPVVILYLAGAWFIAAVISGMPEYTGNNFWARWLVNVLQIIGASLDKVGNAAKKSAAFKQFEQTLQTTDPSGLVKTEAVKTTEQTSTPGVTQ